MRQHEGIDRLPFAAYTVYMNILMSTGRTKCRREARLWAADGGEFMTIANQRPSWQPLRPCLDCLLDRRGNTFGKDQVWYLLNRFATLRTLWTCIAHVCCWLWRTGCSPERPCRAMPLGDSYVCWPHVLSGPMNGGRHCGRLPCTPVVQKKRKGYWSQI